MAEEDIGTDIVEVEAEELDEENPLLIAQRYLNIFHQINIFKAAKKAEFDAELLNMPEKIKKLLINIPGGRILLEHILELEEQNNLDTQLTSALIAQKKKADPLDSLTNNNNLPVQASGEIKVGKEFANVLANSLATALSKTPYSQPLPQFSDGNTVSAVQNRQLNTQNNAAATTVNNIHVDYSIFQNLADAINKNNTQTHDDFMKVVDALNQNFNPTIVQTDGIPLSAITSSLSQVLKESSRQQIEEMKTFSKTLTDAILAKRGDDDTYEERKSEKKKTTENQETKKQTISVTNKTIDPLTSKSTVQKNSYTISPRPQPTPVKKPAPVVKDPILQAENVISRIGLNVKPISLSVDDNYKTNEPAPAKKDKEKDETPQYTEFSLDENLNMNPTDTAYSDEEEWEYVDEDGNPIEDSEEEWEYVDENGNPIEGSEEEWEYVDENGNPITDDEYWEEEDLSAQQEENIPVKETAPIEKKEQPKKETEKKETFEKQPDKEEEIISEIKVEDDKSESKAEIEKTETPKEEPKAEKQEKVSLEPEKSAAEEPQKISLEPEESSLEKQEKVSLQPKEPEKPKTGGILASLFKKKDVAAKEKPVKEEIKAEEPKQDSADDVLAAAFEKPAEEPKQDSADDVLAAAFDKPAEEPKQDSADDALAAAFDKPTEEPKKDSVDDVLAAAFDKPTEEPKKDSVDDALAAAFDKPTEEPKNDSVDDALAAAFDKPTEEPKKDNTPKIGGILADAYKEIEREQKTISSKDLLAQAFKNKPQTTAEVLSSVQKKQEETSSDSADDVLAAAFDKPEKEKNHNDEFEALLKAFNS